MHSQLSPESLAKIRQKEATTPDALKRDILTNYKEGWFFVTLNTRGEAPILSTVIGNPAIPDNQPDAPRCQYTKLGEGVKEAWQRNSEIYENAIVDICEVMPEHFHGLIFLSQATKGTWDK